MDFLAPIGGLFYLLLLRTRLLVYLFLFFAAVLAADSLMLRFTVRPVLRRWCMTLLVLTLLWPVTVEPLRSYLQFQSFCREHTPRILETAENVNGVYVDSGYGRYFLQLSQDRVHRKQSYGFIEWRTSKGEVTRERPGDPSGALIHVPAPEAPYHLFVTRTRTEEIEAETVVIRHADGRFMAEYTQAMWYGSYLMHRRPFKTEDTFYLTVPESPGPKEFILSVLRPAHPRL